MHTVISMIKLYEMQPCLLLYLKTWTVNPLLTLTCAGPQLVFYTQKRLILFTGVQMGVLMIVRLVLFSVITVITVIVASIIIKA